jgi:hypothetical protein
MGMLRDLRKRYLKIRTTAICCFQDPRRHGFKYPISLHELIHIHGRREKPKNGADFVELINQYVIDVRFYGLTIWLLNRQESSQPLNYILFKMSTENCL